MDETESETPLPRNPSRKNPRIGVYTGSATLPPELIDNIINLLCDDEETLATCALVCKSWVPASRYHLSSLFSEITLSPWSIAENSILSSPACTIATAVQHPVLETMNGNSTSSLHEITSRLSNATHLTLCKSDVDEHFSSSLSEVAFMKNLKSLNLSRIRFDTPDMFLELLRQCPRLQSLYCWDVSFSEYPVPQPCPNDQDAVMSGLKTLKVQGSYGLLEYIVGHWDNKIPHLSTLNLEMSRSESAPERILDAVGSTLQDFRLINSPLDISFADRNFPSLTQLQSLAVQFTSTDTFTFVQYMIHALRRLTSPCLQEVTIYILCISRGESLNLDVWSELRPLLESPQFLSTLLKLTFRFDIFTQPEVVDESQRFFAEMFPLCAERGILHVETGFWE